MIGLVLQKHRKRQGLQQKWVAEQAGVSAMTLSRLERDASRGAYRRTSTLNPYWETIGRIAEALNVSLDTIWREEQALLAKDAR